MLQRYKTLILLIIFILIFNRGFGNQNLCGDLSQLLKKIDSISDKKGLLDTAKQCQEELKGSKEYIILLARLYILNENYFFARKILLDFYEKEPDCEVAGYIAYVDFMIGDSDSLKESLALCKGRGDIPELTKARLKLIDAIVSDTNTDYPSQIYPEDRLLLSLIEAKDKEIFKYNIKAKGSAGYTTDAIGGNPLDRTAEYTKGSSLLDYELMISLAGKVNKTFTAGVDMGLKGTEFFNESGALSPSSLSNYTISLIPRVLLSFDSIETTLRYRFDSMFLKMDTEYEKAPIEFFEGHRGEVYVNLLKRYTLFLGVGRRYFDEMVRSRSEFDGGVGYSAPILSRAGATFLLTTRYYDANSKGYDNLGQTALFKLDYKIMNGLDLSQYAGLTFDNYLNSTGYFMNGKIRQDLLFKYYIELTYRLKDTSGIFISYSYTIRDSLIDAFDFSDHRILLGISLNLSSQKREPDMVYKYNFEKRYYQYDSKEGNLQNLMDILQENDSIQRGSQCRD